MAETLGILVNTNRHPDYVKALAQAAGRRGKQVHVHFSGAGLQLANHPSLAGLGCTAGVTLSVDPPSAGTGRQQSEPPKTAVTISQFFNDCDRCVVF